MYNNLTEANLQYKHKYIVGIGNQGNENRYHSHRRKKINSTGWANSCIKTLKCVHAHAYTQWDRKPYLSIGGRVPTAKGAGHYQHQLLLLKVGLVVVFHAVDGAGEGPVKQVLHHVGIALGTACLGGIKNGGLHTAWENFPHHSPCVTHHSVGNKIQCHKNLSTRQTWEILACKTLNRQERTQPQLWTWACSVAPPPATGSASKVGPMRTQTLVTTHPQVFNPTK